MIDLQAVRATAGAEVTDLSTERDAAYIWEPIRWHHLGRNVILN